MKANIPNRNLLDHPEHFDDLIREYKSTDRYIPTGLENLLFELSGHRCSICKAPWLEIHHIQELSNGGETVYENLIVVCPNCHTRIHKENIPTPDELRHYKLKQEVAYELPIFNKLGDLDKELLKDFLAKPKDNRINTDSIANCEISVSISTFPDTYKQAREIARSSVGYNYLEESGIIVKNILQIVQLAEPTKIGISVPSDVYAISIEIRLTPKGLKWLNYIEETGKIDV